MDAPAPPLPEEAHYMNQQNIVTDQPIAQQHHDAIPQEPVVTKQPGRENDHFEKGTVELAKLTHDWEDMRNYFDSLNIAEVSSWDYLEVAERFLRPINLPRLKQIFVEHKINGHTLFGLSKMDLKEMKIMAVGDRVMISNAVAYLSKLKERHEKNRTVWEGVVPFGSVAYYEHFFDMISHKCCPCCNNTDKYRITATSIRVRNDPPACNFACEGVEHNNSDLRFLKDVDWQNEIYCWCCNKNVMLLHFEFDDGDPYKLRIAHPDVGDELVETMQSLWAAQRLVAD